MRVKYSLEDAAFEELRRSVVILSVIYKYMFNRKDILIALTLLGCLSGFYPMYGILSHVVVTIHKKTQLMPISKYL